jgi:flagellar assembly protein FliH
VSEILTIQLDAPVREVAVLGAERKDNDPTHSTAEQQVHQQAARIEQRAKELEQEFASRKAALEQTAQALRVAGDELAQLQKQMIEDMRTQAVDLAMDIARKVLHQEIQSKGYEIDPIVTEALSHLPRRGEITVRLHPEDFERSALAQEDSSVDERIHFTADPDVPLAGCRVNSVEGSVEFSPDTSLEQVEKTLKEND